MNTFLSILSIVLVLGLQACGSLSGSSSDDEVYYEADSTTPISIEDIVGTWVVDIDTRRGTRSNEITIIEENGQLKGYGEKGSFDITRDNNKLMWTSQLDTPRGAMQAIHTVYIIDDTLRGNISASGRTLKLKGKKQLPEY